MLLLTTHQRDNSFILASPSSVLPTKAVVHFLCRAVVCAGFGRACATVQTHFVPNMPQILLTSCLSLGVAHQCYHGFIKAVQEGNIQWESRTYPYPGTPITQRFSHSK